jgi:hypothetical protein
MLDQTLDSANKALQALIRSVRSVHCADFSERIHCQFG